MAPLKRDGAELPGQRVDPGGFRGGFVLLDREQRHAEARPFDRPCQQDGAEHHRQRQQRVDAVIGKLHIGDRIVALDRQRDFLKAEPFEHVEDGERVGEHGQREVVPLQPEGRKADQQSGDAAEDGCDGDHDPWRQIEIDLAEHDGIGDGMKRWPLFLLAAS